MRVALASVALLLLAGCASPSPGPASLTDSEGEAAAVSAAGSQERGHLSIEGRYSALKPLGEPLREDGGRTALAVTGWTSVEVALDSTIEVDLVLLGPGCESVDDPCALRFSPAEGETDGSWTVAEMASGQWAVVVEADADDYSYVDGVYAVHFGFARA